MTEPSAPDLTAAAVAELRRLTRSLAQISTPQLLEVRDAAEACLARERLTASHVARLLATLE